MPERPRVVVVNTTPIISLALIGQLELLQKLYGEVLIPPAFRAEIEVGGVARYGADALSEARYIQTAPLRDPSRA